MRTLGNALTRAGPGRAGLGHSTELWVQRIGFPPLCMSADHLTQKAGSYETALGFHLPELSLLEVTLLQVHPAAFSKHMAGP